MKNIGDRKEFVKEIQMALCYLGYGSTFLVPIDGFWGKNTKDAVCHFQNEKNLNPTGVVDLETYTILMSEKDALDK